VYFAYCYCGTVKLCAVFNYYFGYKNNARRQEIGVSCEFLAVNKRYYQYKIIKACLNKTALSSARTSTSPIIIPLPSLSAIMDANQFNQLPRLLQAD
jgi:hypothetical protein